ncbi:hypothetical protein MMC10_002474 [Thelotrema lepadinum]|nr:hypothetical protein [Thelotrema lepadinum]
MAAPLSITADNRGPLVNIATWITLVAMVLMALTKIATKWVMIGRFQADDGLMFVAMLAGVAQSLAANQQVINGLGQHRSTLTPIQFGNYEKATYAARALYIVTTNLAKLAVLYLLASFTRTKLRRRTVKGAFYFTALWTVVALIVVLLQCTPPNTWDTGGKCIDLLAFWIVYAVVDVMEQVAIGFFPIFLLWELHTSKSKKFVAMGAFTPNLLTIPLIVARMVLLFGNLQNPDSDLTYNTFNTAIIMEIHTMLSIVVACFPFTKPLMDSLSTGLLTSDLRSATARSAARSRYPRFGLSSIRSPKIVSDAKREWFGPSVSGNFSTLDSGEHELTETSHPKDMVINRTITTTVEFEGDDKIYETKV